MRLFLVVVFFLGFSSGVLADALCASNGEKAITIYKYENKGGEYRWINSFLDDLNTFYSRVARDNGQNASVIVERLAGDAKSFSQKGVNPPEVQCVLKLVEGNELAELAKNHLGALRSGQEAKGNAELAETFNEYKKEYILCVDENSKSRILLKKNLASCFDARLKELKSEVEMQSSREGVQAPEVARLKNEFNEFVKVQNQRAATIYDKLPPAQIVKRCIYGVCVGDNINQHVALIQDIDKNIVRNTERQLKSGLVHYETGERAITDPATKLYLAMERFEKDTLDLLSPMDVFCKRKLRLVGSLQTAKSPIFVTIGQIVAPGQKPYWGIFKIDRWYNPPNIADFDKTLQQEYPGISISISSLNDQTTASTSDNGLAYVLSLYMSNDDQFYFTNIEDYSICKSYNKQDI